MNMRGISAVIVEPSMLFREGLGKILSQAGFEVITTVARPEQLRASGVIRPDITLVGSTSSEFCLAADLATVREIFHDTRIVVLSDQFCNRDVVNALMPSACGYLPNGIGSQTLIEALELVMLGQCIIPSELLSSLTYSAYHNGPAQEREALPAPPDEDSSGACKLSQREKEISHLLVHGQSNKTIAKKLNIVESTVKVHIKSIMKKTGAQNRTQAAIWAVGHLEEVPFRATRDAS